MRKTTFIFLAAATIAATPALALRLPDGDGREVVEMVCSGCHDLTPITASIGFSKDDWQTVIKSMIDMGATIKPEQASVIVDYLAKNFPPKPKT